MTSTILAPSRRIRIEPLTESSFSQFGTVIQNPAHTSNPSTKNATTANQGSALKYIDVSHITNFYSLASSQKSAKPVMNMFVCSPRKLRAEVSQSELATDQVSGSKEEKIFDIEILERHPYTPQTFIPMGISREDRSTQYLVIVAPTLQASRSRTEITLRPKPYPTPESKPKRSLLNMFSGARPSPYGNEQSPPTRSTSESPIEVPKGPGMPDLDNIRAFLADGSQAVTYGAGTWHAPMVVVGQKPIDFVVVQYANGVGIEDCQEVLLKCEEGVSEGLTVVIELGPVAAESELKPLRSKL